MTRFNASGFTLIELIIVVALIGMLATALLFNTFKTSTQNGRDAKRITDMRTIQKAMEQCFSIFNQAYPTRIPFGAQLRCGTETLLDPVPKDPDPRLTPGYAASTQSTTDYCTCAYLERKSPNSNDVNCTFTNITPPAGGGGYYCVRNVQ